MARKTGVSKQDLKAAEVMRDARAQSTFDSYQNFAAKLGLQTDNLLSQSTYGFNPVTRIRVLMEWIHRGSWIGGMAIDVVADDMTRAGVLLGGNLKPEQIEMINERATTLGLWNSVNKNTKWARLYGGSIAVLLIDGQDVSTPLKIDRVGEDQFKGLAVLDRWMVEPTLYDLVTEMGPEMGLPKYYTVRADAPLLRNKKVHYTRCLRQIGVELPYWQQLVENLWGLSVLERLYDRMVGFDSATMGAAQLAYKAYLRTYKVKDLRQIIAMGGPAEQDLVKTVNFMARFQSSEGITMVDSEDEFEVHQHSAFTGLSDLLIQLGQQLGGALGVPLTRLFGQSPVGMNSTGESDMRMYYDSIKQRQEADLLVPVTRMYRCIAQSRKIKLPEGFTLSFRPLWQLSDKEKAEAASTNTSSIVQAFEAGLVDRKTALQEARQQSTITGLWSNITDDQIEEAEAEGPPVPEKVEVAAVKELEEGGAAEDADRFQELLKKMPKPLANGFDPGSHKTVRDLYYLARYEIDLYEEGEPTDIKNTGQLNSVKSFMQLCQSSMGQDSILSGNLYKHHGLQVVIEHPQGTVRRGSSWKVSMPADYGYVRRTNGADGDEVDCYVGPAPESSRVFVIDQKDLETGAFDEHKIMLGYYARDSAIEDYVLGYTDGKGPQRIMGTTEISMDEFKEWLAHGDTAKVFGRVQ